MAPGDHIEISTTSTSRASSAIDQILVLGESEKGLTRKVLRIELVDNPQVPAAKMHLRITHQRRRSPTDDWEDCTPFNLAKLSAGEELSLRLSSVETLRLFEYLSWAAGIADQTGGTPMGRHRYHVVGEDEAVVTGAPAKALERLLTEHDEEGLVAALEELRPNLLETVWMRRSFERRSRALDEMEAHLVAEDWNEGKWQTFLDDNEWILGLGLSNKFLETVTTQPPLGGQTVIGSGGTRGDDLLATAAAVRFSVLLEIKKPSSMLVTDREYRNGVYEFGPDVMGGISQVQMQCYRFEMEASQTAENRDVLEVDRDIYTFQPKGILVIGHTQQLRGNRAKMRTFELLRRSLHNPEIITYDELLAKGRAILAQ